MTSAPHKPLRIAAFGFRSIPPSKGGAGADKFALELLPRLAARGHKVVAYNRVYPGQEAQPVSDYMGVEVRSLSTVAASGFDTLLHSAKATWDIIAHNRADVVHIQNGGNSIFALFLRLAGKRTFLSQDGLDWQREKWPWYGKFYLWLMVNLTARIHNAVICDNVFVQDYFQKRFKRSYEFIPFGADVSEGSQPNDILERLGLKSGEYFLFVGRFIPDKGLQYLIPAFSRTKTLKKLVLVGGSPNPSDFEANLRATDDPRIIFPGFVYGADTHALMRDCYAYIQPSDVEGLSPVILESAYLGAPVICSDIEMNEFALEEHGIYFRKSDTDDLFTQLERALDDPDWLRQKGAQQQKHVAETYSWDRVVDSHIELFAAA